MNNLASKAQIEQYILATLKRMQDLIYTEETKHILHEVTEKDIVIFIGNTRSGKSTVVNHVIGNRLVARVTKKNFNIVLDDVSQRGPKIGTEAVSETTIPTVWTSTKISGLVVDAPGFDDNRGEAQDVANAFYIKELIANARSVKFVLICDINDILHHNIGQFITFVDKLYTMLPQSCILPGVCIVFTKDKHENLRQDVKDYLMEKIINQINMKVENRALIQHFVANTNKIVVTNMPVREGSIDENDVFQDMINVIQNETHYLSKEILSKVIPGISDRSKCFLLEAHTHFTELSDFNDVMSKIQMEFKGMTKGIDSDPNAKEKIINLENTIKPLAKINNIYTVLAKLFDLLPNVEELKENSEFHMKLKFVAFVDSVLEMEESSVFHVKINATLSAMIETLKTCMINLQQKMMEISNEDANKKFEQLKEESRKTKQEMQNQIDNLNKINENARINMQKRVGLFSMIGEALDTIISSIGLIKGKF